MASNSLSVPVSFSMSDACEANDSPIVLWNLSGRPKRVVFLGCYFLYRMAKL